MSLDLWSTSSHSPSAIWISPRLLRSVTVLIKDYRIVDSPSPSLEKVNSNSLFLYDTWFSLSSSGFKIIHIRGSYATTIIWQVAGTDHPTTNCQTSTHPESNLNPIPLGYSTSPIRRQSPVEILCTVGNQRDQCWPRFKQTYHQYRNNYIWHYYLFFRVQWGVSLYIRGAWCSQFMLLDASAVSPRHLHSQDST